MTQTTPQPQAKSKRVHGTDADPGSIAGVRVEIQDRIATIIIDRPQVLNALNRAVMIELHHTLIRLGDDPAVGGIILTGAGTRAFVAGADIEELAALTGTGGYEASRLGQTVLRRLEQLPKPSVAAVNGYALGGGCELALACTLRIAAEGARLGLPETTLGIIPGYGGTQRLARLVGAGKALELILTGEPVDAREALRIGLVNRVVPGAELLETATTLLRTILSRGPLAVQAALEVVRAGLDGSLETGLELEARAFGLLCATEDMHEGMRAFLAKRKPAFSGR
jgi:enoyl-CoA hydratase